MTIWNLKRLMSFRDNDLKDACLPILAPVIDQIWSVVLANPPGVMLSEYARWQAWQGTGEWTQQNSHLASIPPHICSSFVLPFLLCSLPTSFYAWQLPMFWTTCPTLLPHDCNCFLLRSESFPFILLFCQCHSDISKVNNEHILHTIAIDLGIYLYQPWAYVLDQSQICTIVIQMLYNILFSIFAKLERRRVFGRSTPVVVKQIPRLFTLSCLLSWPFFQPHRTAHRHLDHELLKWW